MGRTMGKILLRELGPGINLYRDGRTGLAWVEDEGRNLTYNPHPSIPSGDFRHTVRTMKLRGLWKRDCRTAASHGAIYNLSLCRTNLDNSLDVIAMENCRCGGVHHHTSQHQAA
jgi:hypothetical protein